jgi:hypothetical protein
VLAREPFGRPAKKRFNRSQKWQDEFETRSGNLTAMEARSSAGLPTVKTARPRRQYPPESRESSLDPLEESYCSTARLGRLAEAGFGVSGERSLIRLINSAGVVHLRGAPACHAAGRGSSPIAPAIPSKQLRVNGLRSCHATKTRIDASLKHLTSILLYGNIAVWR